MICWNCSRTIPDSAKVCSHCEAPAEPAPTAEELKIARNLLEGLPPEAMAELQSAFLASDTADDFVNRIFVGDCPKCGGSKTGNCEGDPEIDCILVGRCYDCGQLWCTECEKLLTAAAPECECWDEDDENVPDADA